MTHDRLERGLRALEIRALVASLIFVGLQFDQSRRQSKQTERALASNGMASLNTQALDITNQFVDYPELRPCFYDNKPIMQDHELYGKVSAVAQSIVTFFDLGMYQVQFLYDVEEQEVQAWDQAILDSVSSSPILCGYLEQRKMWYPRLFQLVAAHEACL